MWSAPGLQSLARSATLAAPPAPSLHADGHRAGSSGRAMQPCPLQVPRVLGLRTAPQAQAAVGSGVAGMTAASVWQAGPFIWMSRLADVGPCWLRPMTCKLAQGPDTCTAHPWGQEMFVRSQLPHLPPVLAYQVFQTGFIRVLIWVAKQRISVYECILVTKEEKQRKSY